MRLLAVRRFRFRKSIRTLVESISSHTRRFIAKSRVGVIIDRIVSSRSVELYSAVFLALAVLVFYGSSSEGQASFFNAWVQNYVEEKALALNSSRQLSSLRIADMSSFFAGIGGDGTAESPAPSTDAATIGESAVAAFTPPDSDYMNRISSRRSSAIEYTVQDGDLLSFIASDFGVSQLSIVWANNLKDADAIAPGQILRIPPVSGVIYTAKRGDTAMVLAKKYGADVEQIIAYNHLSKDGDLNVGDELIIPNGRIVTGTPSVPLLGTASVAKLAAAASLFTHLPDLGDFFKIPALGFDWGRIHGRNGVDVANSCGTTIYAAADGTVAIADAVGYNGGFGKYIKLSHANGTETLYAHASKLLVQIGQSINKGDKIALMGTTGRSTGCHLHFEVHGARNPLAKY